MMDPIELAKRLSSRLYNICEKHCRDFEDCRQICSTMIETRNAIIELLEASIDYTAMVIKEVEEIDVS